MVSSKFSVLCRLCSNQLFISETNEKRILSNAQPLRAVKNKSDHDHRNYDFVDQKRVRVKGGKGGDGMICFLQLFNNPRAGPSGGDGGNGGHIIFRASSNVKSLNHLKSSYRGIDGQNGMSKDMTGKNAEHLWIELPVGTLVRDPGTSKIIADLNCDKIQYLAARGGAGGKGNHYFLSNQNRHPNVAELGASGEENVFILEMKIIAHAGLIGFPNSGKSTLLSALSRAKPKVASYPFTTIKPNIGIIHYDDDEQLAIADLPGLIKGAHRNKGLGISFLRHIDRCVCLFYVIDISQQEPYEQFSVLVDELNQYNPNLSQRPIAIILNKIDSEKSDLKLERFRLKLQQNNLQHLKVIAVSGKFGINLKELLLYFRELYDRNNLNSIVEDSFD
ncbi:cytochrome B5 [Sarcoptes scabiei]|nr:cytochrome B5 [Sarcoptes scabiei]